MHYVTAEYMRIKASSQFLDSDREKLTSDLTSAFNTTILIQDTRVPQGPLMISDREVASDDQNYFFDREIQILAGALNGLGVNANSFAQVADAEWAQRLQSFHRSLGVIVGSTAPATASPARRSRFVVANLPGDYSYRRCHPADQNGQPFGDAVADDSCTVGYRTDNLPGDYSYRRCHPVDQNNQTFGDAVSDAKCEAQ